MELKRDLVKDKSATIVVDGELRRVCLLLSLWILLTSLTSKLAILLVIYFACLEMM